MMDEVHHVLELPAVLFQSQINCFPSFLEFLCQNDVPWPALFEVCHQFLMPAVFEPGECSDGKTSDKRPVRQEMIRSQFGIRKNRLAGFCIFLDETDHGFNIVGLLHGSNNTS